MLIGVRKWLEARVLGDEIFWWRYKSVRLTFFADPSTLHCEHFGIQVVVDVNSGGALNDGGVIRSLCKKRFRGFLDVSESISEADNIVVELEWGLPVDVKSLEAVNAGVFDWGGYRLLRVGRFEARGWVEVLQGFNSRRVLTRHSAISLAVSLKPKEVFATQERWVVSS